MKLEEAIKRLRDSLDHNTPLVTRGDKDAVRLGIEALERVHLYRKGIYIGLGDKMPGETED